LLLEDHTEQPESVHAMGVIAVYVCCVWGGNISTGSGL
jgi:hypothetical protein